jgi:hypothetical protein
MMLVLHDDAQREYAYGPAQGLPETKVGAFSQDLYEEAKIKSWIVISVKKIVSVYSPSTRMIDLLPWFLLLAIACASSPLDQNDLG